MTTALKTSSLLQLPVSAVLRGTMRILPFRSRKLPAIISLAFMCQSWAWKGNKATMVHIPTCQPSITNSRCRSSAMDDSTTTSSSSSSEVQKSQDPLHPLCKPFPVSPESETIDEVNFDWRSIASSVFNAGDSRPVVLFDGVCNLCNGAVNFSLDHDSKGKSLPP